MYTREGLSSDVILVIQFPMLFPFAQYYVMSLPYSFHKTSLRAV